MNENLKFWNDNCKVPIEYTKNANNGKIDFTAIDTYWRFMKGTELWGMYGKTWGLKNITHDYDVLKEQKAVKVSAIFFYAEGQFQISDTIKHTSSKGAYDEDHLKKIESGLIGKAMSRLGIGADVYMGKFEDDKYIKELKYEKLEKDRVQTRLSECDTVKKVEELYEEIKSKADISKYIDLFTKRKEELGGSNE
jgi:hypothetical protein